MRNNTPKINDDKQWRKIIKEHTPDPPVDPWFRRKVLNRLPPKKEPVLYPSEVIGLIAVTGSLGTLIYHEFRSLLSSPDPTTFNYGIMGFALAASLITALCFMVRILQRS